MPGNVEAKMISARNSMCTSLQPEDPETSHPSATQMGHVRIWQISDHQSKSGRRVASSRKKLDYSLV
jgi:hypothetical protein